MKNGIDFKITNNNSKSRFLGENLNYPNLVCVIDLKEIKAFDKDNLLPSTGSLEFYYDKSSNYAGYDYKISNEYKVIYKENPVAIATGLGLNIKESNTFPDDDDILSLGLNKEEANPHDFHLRMLGWPHLINGSHILSLELSRKKFDVSKGFRDIAPFMVRKAKREALNWVLLMEIDSNLAGNYNVGDAGSLYYYIHKDDLAKRDFSKVYLVRGDF